MGKYSLTNKAVEDLSDIWSYTFDIWSEKQADLYYEILILSCQEIANTPALGKIDEEIAGGLYGFITNKHVIFYRIISDDEVEVIRILHGSMDLKNRIRD